MAPPPDDTVSDPDGASPEFDDGARRAEHLESVLAPRLTDRQRATRIGTLVGTVLLTFVLLCALVPEVRLSVQRAFSAPTAAPTGALAAGDDTLWFTPLAPGETLELDGRALPNPPPPGDAHPLHLSQGAHQVAWDATPFQPRSCLLTVPRSPGDTCPTTLALDPGTHAAGRILDDSESLATLPDPLRLALTAAVSTALVTPYNTTVQPGEYYRSLEANALSPVLTPTRQPLLASASFVEITGWSEPCALNPLVACRAEGQDCEQLCTILPTSANAAPGAGSRNALSGWYVGLTAGLVWTYATPDGHVLEQGGPDASLDFTLLVLRVNWDGAIWSVTPVLGAIPGLAAARDITCSALTYDLNTWVEQNAAQPFVDVRTAVRYASDGDPTDGCVGVVTATSFGNAGTPTPVTGTPPLLLHRFGMLLAANAAAHATWPSMPVADPAEAALAARMAAA